MECQFPAAAEQLRLWIFQHANPGDQSYVIRSGRRFSEPLDHSSIARAATELLAAHPVLGWAFEYDGETLTRRESKRLPGDLWIVYQAEQLDTSEALQVESKQLTDLASGRLFRFVLIEHASGISDLYLLVHHVVCDSRSTEILWRDFAAVYSQSALRLVFDNHYGERAITSVQTNGDRSGSPQAVSELRSDFQPANHQRVPQRVELTLTACLRDKAEVLAARFGATPFAVLLAAFGTAVMRYDPTTPNFVICTQIDTRRDEADFDAVGFFVRTLPIYFNTESRLGIDDLVQNVMAQVFDGLDGGPQLEDVVSRSGFSGSYTVNPFDGVSFQQLANTEADVTLGPLAGIPLHDDGASTSFNISVTVGMPIETGSDSPAWATYDASRYSVTTVHQLWDLMAKQIESAAQETGPYPVNETSELSPVMQSPSEVDSRITEPEYPNFVDLLLGHANDDLAIITDEEDLTYGRVRSRIEALSSRIQTRVDGEAVVAIDVANRLERVLATLAVWHSGCTVVHIEPGINRAAMRWIPIGLTLRDEDAPDGAILGSPTLALRGGDASDFGDCPPRTAPTNAYVVQTSGSTGDPALVRRSTAVLQTFIASGIFRVESTWTVGQVSSLASDPGMRELICTLAAGATLYISDDIAVSPVDAIAKTLEEGKADALLCIVPSVLHTMLEHLRRRGFRTKMQVVRCVGEPLHRDTAAMAREILGVVPHVDYGTAEAAMITATHHSTEVPTLTRFLPIGRPYKPALLAVIDNAGAVCPPNIVGELVIGGAHVAPGYIGPDRPGLTCDVNENWVHRTGDWGYRDPTGTFHWIGRRASTLKVRGRFVDVLAVESVAKSLPMVVDAHAWVEHLNRPDAQLILVVVTNGNDEINLDELRGEIAAKLDATHVPSKVGLADSIDRSPSGKVVPFQPRSWLEASRANSRESPSELESTLIDAFRRVLRIQNIDHLSDFFTEGGTSLSGLSLVRLINLELGSSLDLRALLMNPTPRQLCRFIEGSADDNSIMTTQG